VAESVAGLLAAGFEAMAEAAFRPAVDRLHRAEAGEPLRT
jgi:hypothetical protein